MFDSHQLLVVPVLELPTPFKMDWQSLVNGSEVSMGMGMHQPYQPPDQETQEEDTEDFYGDGSAMEREPTRAGAPVDEEQQDVG